MRYTTLLTYKGYEDYKTKDERDSKLYLFENEYGELQKKPLKEAPNCEIGDQCKVVLKEERYYHRKAGQYVDRVTYELVEPINN